MGKNGKVYFFDYFIFSFLDFLSLFSSIIKVNTTFDFSS